MSSMAGETAPGGLPLGRIEKQIELRESMLWARVGLKLAVGIPLTLLVPLAVAIVLTLWWGISFFLWFILACAGWSVLAYRICKTQDGRSFFAEAMVEEIGGDKDYWSTASSTEFQMKHQTAGLLAQLDIVLFGPREVYEAWELIRERRQFDAPSRLRAAEAVLALLKSDTGMPWLTLKHQNETVEQLLRVLGYLRFTEWIGISSDGNKVWLLTDARKSLAR